MFTKVCSVFCILFCLTFRAIADDPNANEIIEMYEKSLSVLDKSAYDIETKMVIEGLQNPESPEVIIRKSFVCRDADRWSTVIEDQYVFENAQKPSEIHHITVILDKHSIIYSSEGDKPVSTVIVDSNLELGRVKTRAALGGGIIAEGYILGDDGVRLPDILRSSLTLEVGNDRPEIDGHVTYVLESQGKNGKIKLWLDPNSGFHPRRIEVKKSGKDLLNGLPVSSTRSWANIVPNKQLERYSVVIDSFKIEDINDVFVMTGANTIETKTYTDGYKVRVSYDFIRSKINLNPDFDALRAFEIKVPDGTRVYVTEYPGIRYVCQNGQIVPNVDKPSFEEIDKMIKELKKENN